MPDELVVPPAELVDVDALRVDGQNPNVQSARQFKALGSSKKSCGNRSVHFSKGVSAHYEARF